MAFVFNSPGLKFKERDLTSGRRSLKKTKGLSGNNTGSTPTPIPPLCGKQFPTGYMYNSIILFNCKTW